MQTSLEELIKLNHEKSLDDLIDIVEQKITSIPNYQISMWDDFIAPRLYRARKHNRLEGNFKDDKLHAFESESEFWNTPQEFCPLGRCQNEGESLLYCSTSWETAISEVRPNVGDFVSVSIYNARLNPEKPNTLLGSRIVPIGVQYLSQIERLQHMFKDYNFKGRNAEFYELDNFLDDLFHMNVREGEEHLYNLSIAVTRCMMKNMLDGGVSKQMHGMIYSSMVRKKSDYNFVIRPIHARTIYRLFEVQTFEVLETTEKKIKLKLVRQGMTLGEKHHPLDFFQMAWLDVNNGDVDEIDRI